MTVTNIQISARTASSERVLLCNTNCTMDGVLSRALEDLRSAVQFPLLACHARICLLCAVSDCTLAVFGHAPGFTATQKAQSPVPLAGTPVDSANLLQVLTFSGGQVNLYSDAVRTEHRHANHGTDPASAGMLRDFQLGSCNLMR